MNYTQIKKWISGALISALVLPYLISFPKAQAAPRQESHDLIILLVEEDLLNNNSVNLKDKIIRYTTDLQNSFSNTKTLISSVSKNTPPREIALALENLYFNGDTSLSDNKLRGLVIIGDVPIPLINNSGQKQISLYPYTDFIEPAVTWNSDNQEYVYNGSSHLLPELWHGLIIPPVKTPERLKLLSDFFDKNHAYHSGEISFSAVDKTLLFVDNIEQSKSLTKQNLAKYNRSQKFLEDIEYLRYDQTLLQQLQNELLAETNDLYASQNLANPFSESPLTTVSDVYAKPVADKYFSCFLEANQNFFNTTADWIFNTGRYVANENADLLPFLVSTKDLFTKKYLHYLNDEFEKNIVQIIQDDFQASDIQINKEPTSGSLRAVLSQMFTQEESNTILPVSRPRSITFTDWRGQTHTINYINLFTLTDSRNPDNIIPALQEVLTAKENELENLRLHILPSTSEINNLKTDPTKTALISFLNLLRNRLLTKNYQNILLTQADNLDPDNIRETLYWNNLKFEEKQFYALKKYLGRAPEVFPKSTTAGYETFYLRGSGDQTTVNLNLSPTGKIDTEFLDALNKKNTGDKTSKTTPQYLNDIPGGSPDNECGDVLEGVELWEWFPAIICWLSNLEVKIEMSNECSVENSSGEIHSSGEVYSSENNLGLSESQGQNFIIQTLLNENTLVPGIGTYIDISFYDQDRTLLINPQKFSVEINTAGELDLSQDIDPEMIGLQTSSHNGHSRIYVTARQPRDIKVTVNIPERKLSHEIIIKVLPEIRIKLASSAHANSEDQFKIGAALTTPHGSIITDANNQLIITTPENLPGEFNEKLVIRNGTGVILFSPRNSRAKIEIQASHLGFRSDSKEINLAKPVAHHLEFIDPPLKSNINQLHQLQIKAFDQYDHPIDTYQTPIRIKITDQTSELAKLEATQIIANSNGLAEVSLGIRGRSGTVNLIAESGDLLPATLSLPINLELKSTDLTELNPQIIYGSLYGFPAADFTQTNYWGGWLLFSGKTQAVTANTTSPRQPALVQIHPHGKIVSLNKTYLPQINFNSKNLAIDIIYTVTGQTVYQQVFNDFDNLKISEYNPQNISPGIYYEYLNSYPGLDIKTNTSGLQASIYDFESFTINPQGKINITNNNINLAIDQNADYLLINISLNKEEIARLHFILPSQDLLKNIPQNPEYQVQTILTGNSTTEAHGIELSKKTTTTLGNNSNPGSGFERQDKKVLAASANNYLGEALRYNQGITEVFLGDPSIRFNNPSEISGTGFDKSIGLTLFKDQRKTIHQIIDFDYNNDQVTDLLLNFKNGDLQLIEGLNSNPFFRDKGSLLRFPLPVQEIVALDLGEDGFDDLIIILSDQTVLFAKNNQGHFSTKRFDFNRNSSPSNIEVADLDRDNHEDLITSFANGDLVIFYGNGQGDFSTEKILGNAGTTLPSIDLSSGLLVSFDNMNASPQAIVQDILVQDETAAYPDFAEHNIDTESLINSLNQTHNLQLDPPQYSQSITFDYLNKQPLLANTRKIGQDVNGGTMDIKDILTYEIRLQSNQILTNVQLWDPLPNRTKFVSNSLECNNCPFDIDYEVSDGLIKISPFDLRGDYIFTYRLQVIDTPDLVLGIDNFQNNDQYLDLIITTKTNISGQSVLFFSTGPRSYRKEISARITNPDPNQIDLNNNGTPDRIETDTNGDGIPDIINSTVSQYRQDDDGDGIPNYYDDYNDLTEQSNNTEDNPGGLKGLADKVASIAETIKCGGGCINAPINNAFFVPGNINVPFGNPATGMGTPVGRQIAQPFFGAPGPTDLIPTCADLEGGPPCFPQSTMRIYLSPTTTGGLGLAHCTGIGGDPFQPLGKCQVIAPPIAQMAGVCEDPEDNGESQSRMNDQDSLGNNESAYSVNESSYQNSGGNGSAGVTGLFQLGSFSEPSQFGTFQRIPSFDDFGGIITRWWDAQIEEVATKLTVLPDIFVIIPNFKNLFDSESMAEFMEENEVSADINDLSSSLRILTRFLKKIPFLTVKEKTVIIKIPWMSPERVQDLQRDMEEWVQKTEDELTAIPDKYSNQIISQLNANALKIQQQTRKYLDQIKGEIVKIENKVAEYQNQIIGYLVKYEEPLHQLFQNLQQKIQELENIDQVIQKYLAEQLQIKIIEAQEKYGILLAEIEKYRDFPEQLKKYQIIVNQLGKYVNSLETFEEDLQGWLKNEIQTKLTELTAQYQDVLLKLQTYRDYPKQLEKYQAVITKYRTWLKNSEEQLQQSIQNIPENLDLEIDLEDQLAIVKENIKTLESYAELPQKIMEFKKLIPKFLNKIVCYLENITELTGGYLARQKQIIVRWMSLIITLIQLFKQLSGTIDTYIQKVNSCKLCTNERYGLNVMQALGFIIPNIPVIPFPKWPDIVFDVSELNPGATIVIPKIELVGQEINFPSLPNISIPKLPNIDLGINLPDLPAFPSLPELPDLPDLELSGFPNLEIPNLPGLPALPDIDLPDPPLLPDINIPDPLAYIHLPPLPELPQFKLPDLPPLPDIPAPDLPTIPTLELPDFSAQLNLSNLDIPKLPALPELPVLPELPPIPMIKLPDLPPPPKLPDFIAQIQAVLDSIAPILDMYCQIKQVFTPIDEFILKEEIEQLTMRPSKMQGMDFQFLIYPKFTIPFVDEIQVKIKVNMQLAFSGIYTAMETIATQWNAIVTDLINESEKAKKQASSHSLLDKPLAKLKNELNILNKKIKKPEFIEAYQLAKKLNLKVDYSPINEFLALEHQHELAVQKQVTRLKNRILDYQVLVSQNLDSTAPENLFARIVPFTENYLASEIISETEETIKFANWDINPVLAQVTTELNKLISPRQIAQTKINNTPPKTTNNRIPRIQPCGLLVHNSATQHTEQIIRYRETCQVDLPLVSLDFDEDNDLDLIYAIRGELFLKIRQRSNDTGRSHVRFTSPPKEINLLDYIPEPELLTSLKITNETNKQVTFTWRQDIKEAGLEITIYESIESAQLLDQHKIKRIFLLKPEYMDRVPPFVIDEPIAGPGNLNFGEAQITLQENETGLITRLSGKEYQYRTPNGFYFAKSRIINNDLSFGKTADQLLLAPNPYGQSDPLILLADNYKIPVFKEIALDALEIFDDTDYRLAWDTDGDGRPDNAKRKIILGPFDTVGTFPIKIWVIDIAGNQSSKTLQINVFAPDLSLDYQAKPDLKDRKFSGLLNPPVSGMPISLLRQRRDHWQAIKTPQADKLGKYYSDPSGVYFIDELNFDLGINVKNKNGEIVAYVHPENGRMIIKEKFIEDYNLSILGSSTRRPMRTILSPHNSAEIMANEYWQTDKNSDLQIGDKPVTPENYQNIFGAYLVDLNPNDKLLAKTINPLAYYYGGGAVIYKEDYQEGYALINRDGSVRLLNDSITVRTKDYSNVLDPVIWEILVEGTPQFELYLRPKENNLHILFDEIWPRTEPQLFTAPIRQISQFISTPPFTDVPDNHPFAEAINLLRNRGILTGYADGSFKPENKITRAEFVKIVLGATTCRDCTKASPNELQKYGLDQPFPDVINQAWYYFCIIKGKALKIIQGYGDGFFRPEQNISRAEAAAVLLRQSHIALKKCPPHTYLDVPVYAWYLDDVHTAVQLGMIENNAGSVLPDEKITRAEFAKMTKIVIQIRDCRILDTDKGGIYDYIEEERGTDYLDPNDDFTKPDKEEEYNAEIGDENLCPEIPKNISHVLYRNSCPYLEDHTSSGIPQLEGIYLVSGDFCAFIDWVADIRPGDIFQSVVSSWDNLEVFSKSNTVLTN